MKDATEMPILDVPYSGPHMVPFMRLQKQDGVNVRLFNGRVEPDEFELVFGANLFDQLNRELRVERGGAWAIVWFDPKATFDAGGVIRQAPQGCEIRWLDADGDAPFAIELDLRDSFIQIEPEKALANIVEQCEHAYLEYRAQLADVGIDLDKHGYRPAKGQAPKNPNDTSTPYN